MIQKIVSILIRKLLLVSILCGTIKSPEQIKIDVDKEDLNYLSAVMQLENGNRTGDLEQDNKRLLLTGSVVLNRVNSDSWSGDTIKDVILAKEGKYWQYAPNTRNNFMSLKANDHIQLLAKYLLIYGPICPENVVYQGQTVNGSGEYDRIHVKGDKDEIFCYQ